MGNMSNKIIKTIGEMSGKYDVYRIFADWVKLMALAFANQIQFSQKREKDYIETMNSYTKDEQNKFYQMTAWLVEWADTEFNDMLGYIYMHLEISSKKAGQFFTPYHVCYLMAKLTPDHEGRAKINEPSCGAGGNIIALAHKMHDEGINYQKEMMVICQDIDIKAVYMTYVQLTLYGIPAIVYQTDTLRDPCGTESATGKLYTYGYVMANYYRKEG